MIFVFLSKLQMRNENDVNILKLNVRWFEPYLIVACLLLHVAVISAKDVEDVFHEDDFTSNAETVAVRLRRSDYSMADEIAQKHGFINHGQIGDLEGHFLYKRKSGRISKRHALETLGTDPDVTWHEVQLAKKRVKRDLVEDAPPVSRTKRAEFSGSWSDPLWNQQWFLHHGAVGGYDMSVQGAWKMGFSGKGVVISILDDGIEPTHPDLAPNYDPRASKDINDGDDDPTPQDNGDNKHGTRCAGEVAAVAGNDMCGVGVAFNSSIGGVRMLDGPVSDSVEAASLSLNQDHIDIYSASWGPEDDGRTFDGPGPLAKEAFFRGVTKGRGGKGNIFIWASGNGGSHLDSCSCDGYTTSIYTLSVSSATFNNQKPWYLEECPSTLTTTYSSAGLGQPAIVTVDMPHGCTDQHTGTSASAPLAAGIVALALEANPSLTWRDMQHLVMRTSDPSPLLNNPGWVVNGAGRKVSNRFGYGLMHAENLVKLAQTWRTVPEQHVCSYQYHMTDPNPRPVSGRFQLNFSLPVAGCSGDEAVNYLEQVHVLFTGQLTVRGDFQIYLLSPMGTRSLLLPARPQDQTRQALVKWPFLSVQQWGEDPRGTWTLTVENVGSETNTGSISDWTLILYGTDRPAQTDDATLSISSTGNAFAAIGGIQGSSVDHSLSQFKLLTTGCHEECDKGCYLANSDTDCEGCKHYSLHKRNRGGVRCLRVCNVSEGYWADEKDKRCKQCMSECRTCSSGDQCDSCRIPQLLVLSDNPAHAHHGRCHKDCPSGFEEIKGNYTCIPIKGQTVADAKSCDKEHYLSLDSRCVKHCPDNQYATLDHKCLKCPEACRTCIGSSVEDCIDCADGFQRDANSCKPIIFMVRPKSCSEDNGYMDMVFTDCRRCHSSCDGCTGPTPAQCLRCSSGHKNYSGLCISQSSSSSSHPHISAQGLSFTKMALLACGGATVLFLVVFGILMCKDRNYERNARLYSYSALPVKYALDTKEMIITPGSSPERANGKMNGHFAQDNNCLVLSDDADSDQDEDTLFAHDQLTARSVTGR